MNLLNQLTNDGKMTQNDEKIKYDMFASITEKWPLSGKLLGI